MSQKKGAAYESTEKVSNGDRYSFAFRLDFSLCRPRATVAVLAKPGDTVQLLHPGAKAAKEEFCLNEVVPVYRYTGLRKYRTYKQVGKVKITGYVGDHNLEGIVVEGNIKGDDFVEKEDTGCLVKTPEPEGK